LHPDGRDWRGITHYIDPDGMALYSFFPLDSHRYKNKVDGNIFSFERMMNDKFEKPLNEAVEKAFMMASVMCLSTGTLALPRMRKPKTVYVQ